MLFNNSDGVPGDVVVRVLLFGHYRDVSPDPMVLSLPAGATVADAANALALRDARFADLLTRTRQAIGAEFAAPDTVLQNNTELAFLPPMSGG